MTLVHNTYGKGRVRVLRLARGDRHEPRETNVRVMLEGDFGRAYVARDNSTSIATDSIKNLVYVVARENLAADNETFALAIAHRFLDRYKQIERITATLTETRWTRAAVHGALHPHAFTLDGNGTGHAEVVADRLGHRTESGLNGYTLMKTTESGWSDYVMDDVTTLKPTRDRILATSMQARWAWHATPTDYGDANALVLRTMFDVFASTYSDSVQDSLYRMAEAVLQAVPQIARISLACPNKHYVPFDTGRFGVAADNAVFVATDEPHGQIECIVARDEVEIVVDDEDEMGADGDAGAGRSAADKIVADAGNDVG